MKFLAPVGRGPVDDEVRAGEFRFKAIGCGSRHVPVLLTGNSVNPVFDRKPVPLYSDPLLHDGGAAKAADAILAHGNEAAKVTERYRLLTPPEQLQLAAFLGSL